MPVEAIRRHSSVRSAGLLSHQRCAFTPYGEGIAGDVEAANPTAAMQTNTAASGNRLEKQGGRTIMGNLLQSGAAYYTEADDLVAVLWSVPETRRRSTVIGPLVDATTAAYALDVSRT